jgi:alkylation response protein AidB-like acyl-CoA dehydrogenase
MQLPNDFESSLIRLIDKFDDQLVESLDTGYSICEPDVLGMIRDSGVLLFFKQALENSSAVNYLAHATFLASTKCCNLRNLFLVSFGMVGEILRCCSVESKLARDQLDSIFSGKAVGALAVTETSGGTDHTKHKTTIKIRPDGSLILNGTKTWITFGVCCDFYVVQCEFDGVIRMVLVHANFPGVYREPILDLVGNRGSGVGTVHFKDVILTESQMLPLKIRRNLNESPNRILDFESRDIGFKVGRLIAAASGLGLGTSCLEKTIRELRNRKSFGHSVIEQAGWRARLSHAIIDRNILRAAIFHSLEHYEDQLFSHFDHWTPLKIKATEFAKKSSQLFMEASGSRGYVETHSSNRFVREAFSFDFIEGATEPLQTKCFLEFQKEMLLGKNYDFI